MRLSLCIATLRRGRFIAQTLDSILPQLPADAEVVVVDGASPDETPDVMGLYAARDPRVRYFREETNSGVDRDYDKAVGYARGEYCWLMSDDDLLLPGAVARLLATLERNPDLVVVNAEFRDGDLDKVLLPRIMDLAADAEYGPEQVDEFFAVAGNYLSFIGGVVIRRDVWMARERAPYFGSLFIHVGVIFQAPMERVVVLADPWISIRLGNSMWSPRAFEVWVFLWPRMVWSFQHISAAARARVCARELWRIPNILLFYRGLGSYTWAAFRQHVAPEAPGAAALVPLAIALIPAPLVNLLSVLALLRSRKPTAPMQVYTLLRSPAAFLTRPVAHLLGARPS